MSEFLYRGRHCVGEWQARARSLGNKTDVSCDEPEKGLPAPGLQTHRLREFEQHLNDLKKENFSLKLRIYFLEERIQQKYEESSEDVYKRNIELKVEVESLKQDLTEKQNILDKALSTADSLTNQNEKELQRLCEERQQEISHIQEILETKIQLLQEQAQLARGEAEKMASLAEAESQRCLALERGVEAKEALAEKDRLIGELTEEKQLLSNQVAELEVTIHDLSSSLQRKDRDADRLLDEQQSQLSQYESGAGQCVTELQKARYQVTSLQAKIKESEDRNQKLQVCLGEMERELCLVREEAQRQERTVLNLTDTVSSQQTETVELYRVIEEQNNMLCSLKELVSRNELQTPQVSRAESVRGHGEVLALQVSLFQAQLELQAGKRAQRQATRRGEDLSRALTRLEADIQEALEHKHSTDRHNQDLHLALDKAGGSLRRKEEHLMEEEGERRRQKEDMEKTIAALRTSLQSKEQLLQEYLELLEQQQGPREKREPLLARLRQRIKERDRALERAVDEKFRCVEEKEGEVQRLRLLIRDKDRDLERQRCVLSNNQETITSLELLLRGKGLELEQVCEAWRSVQHHHEDSEQRHAHSLRERDALVSQLQNALHTRVKEAEHLTTVLLGKVRAGPSEVVEELKARLSLKEKLFQDLLSDHSRQGLEHHSQVQELLNTIAARDQYIKDSAGRLGEVITEQTIRLQELCKQLNSGCLLGLQGPEISPELQTMREELRLALMREREAQAELTDLKTQGSAWPAERQTEFEEFSSDEQDDDVKSEYADSKVTTLQKAEHGGGPGTWKPSQDAVGGGEAQVEVKQLVQQKMVVERELRELKAQLVKAGFSSLSQLRKALYSLPMENEEVTAHHTARPQNTRDDLRFLENEEEDEEELHVDDEEEELCRADLWEGWDDAPIPSVRESGMGKRHCTRPMSLDLGAQLSHSTQDIDEEEVGGAGGSKQSHTEAVPEAVVEEDAARLQMESKELQERLMVSEATVQAQAEQLKDYRELLTETPVQQDSKQVQVDLPDMGYETCGRSENEAEREETSSPEFDDLEMCTTLECSSSKWWSGTVHPGKAGPPASTSQSSDINSLQRLVEDLRSQLSHSQTVIRNLQGRLRSISTSSDTVVPSHGPSNGRKVNWSFQFQASPSQSSPEDDEGWESSGGGLGPSHHPKHDKDLQQLESRVGAIEDQLRRDKGTPVGTPGPPEAATWPGPGRFDTLIQAQARELSHLRQRMREGLGVCHILTQHLGDTTKAFEELLRANDIDYYMGQSFREQLAQSSALAQRASSKISGRDHPEIEDDKTGTELLAIRLSKELQQKDKTIEALRAKLNLNQPRSETPCSSHGLSDITDQSDCISFVSDEQGSTNDDLDLCSEIEASSSHCNSITTSHHPSSAPSNTPSHGHQSSVSHPSMQHSGDTHSQRGFTVPSGKPFGGFPLSSHPQTDSCYLPQPLSFLTFQPSTLNGSNSGLNIGLNASSAMKAGASLPESSALWDMGYPAQPMTVADLSSGSSGYQSGTSHIGSDLMKEHLREIRSLRQRLEDSIQANERLRQQLEERLANQDRDKAAPTNIYIQGLDSVSQLSSDLKVLQEENLSLQARLQQASRDGIKEAEQLQEAVTLGRAQLKEAELETEQWAEQVRRLQTQAQTQTLEMSQLKQDRQSNQEAINRLQHEVSVLQQQLCESRGLIFSLESELQMYQRVCGVSKNTHADQVSHSGETATFDTRDVLVHMEQQGTSGTRPAGAKKQLFYDQTFSPPDGDPGGFSTAVLPSTLNHQKVDMSIENHNGRHAVGHVDDFRALQQQILEGCIHIGKMQTTLQVTANCSLLELSQDKAVNAGCLRSLLTSIKTLQQILEEASSLLRRFWRAAGTEGSPQSNQKEQSLKDEVHILRQRISEQEEALRVAMESLRSSNRTKDSMEHFIVSQLSRTKDVLKKARTNLEAKTREASGSSSSLLFGVS